MANLSLSTHPPRKRSQVFAQGLRTESDLLARTLERLNRHLTSSLVASGEVRDHSRPGD